jgi:hypothetical protein
MGILIPPEPLMVIRGPQSVRDRSLCSDKGTAEAYGRHKFWGRVIRVGGILGKENIRTDEPSEHVDTKILETLVELDPGQQLPLGLRVDSYVESEEGTVLR